MQKFAALCIFYNLSDLIGKIWVSPTPDVNRNFYFSLEEIRQKNADARVVFVE